MADILPLKDAFDPALALLAATWLARGVLPALTPFQWTEVAATVAPALLILIGLVRLRRSRLDAYRTFKTAILVMIFVTQFFAFYHQQLTAVFGMFASIVVWVTLRSMIHEEERMLQ